MEDIRPLVADLQSAWARAFAKAQAAPAAWAPYLPSNSLVLVDEAVRTACGLMNRVKAPKGFSPAFHLARSVAAVSLPQLITQTNQIEAAQYNQFPVFLATLSGLLSAIHSLQIYSSAEDLANGTVSLAAELSQGLALLGTAQSELAGKKKELEAADEIAQKIYQSQESAEDALAEIKERRDAAETANEEIASAQAAAKQSGEDISEIQTKLAVIASEADKLRKQLAAVIGESAGVKNKIIEQQALVDSLLPRAASAGLAAAFASRESSLELVKWVWVAVFVGSLGALAFVAWHISQSTIPVGMTYWEYLASRIPLAAPLIWLGWFSAIQYGNTVRVQEDYAFKEATSKAFQGYRDHMEHLADVDASEGKNALNLLAVKTIEILAREPLRIFGKTHHDASPAGTIASMFRRGQKPKAGETESDE